MIELQQAYLYLILIGSTIGAVLLHLWLQARNVNKAGLMLIRLNEQLNFDAPAFLRAAWIPLSQAGLRGIAWQMDWFGALIEGEAGQLLGRQIRREIQATEMRLNIVFYRRSVRGERDYFDETLMETFLLLLRTDMWIKSGATDATFAQMSKLNLFLQHDMKNIAQFIQLLADQLAEVPPGKEAQVLEHLRIAAPLMRHRADHVVRTLMARQPYLEAAGAVQLRDQIERLCRLHQLDYRIDGDAEVYVPEKNLDSAFDNIFKNYRDLVLRDKVAVPLVKVEITSTPEAVDVVIYADQVVPGIEIERLFEPFWSRDPSGLGIGLYQAKQMLEACNASLSARFDPVGRLQFVAHFPQKRREAREPHE